MVDADRLWRRLEELAEIGPVEGGGVTRLSFTGEERAAKDLVASYMEEAGLAVREDAVGNLIGRREGRDPDAPTALAGSHVDSVPSGGDFDGPLGVLAAIEAVRTMREEDVKTERPVEVVAFTDEEGARFGLGMIGSRALAGLLAPDDLSREDESGVTIAEAMREAGLNPDRVGEAAREPGSVHAYVELHIEQGRVLEQRNLPVGVVTGIAGPTWLRFVLRGEAGHAGATPMGSMRHDALAAAAVVIGAVEREAERSGSSVGTVGRMEVEPGGVNVIPGRATFTLDLRDIDGNARDRLEARIVDEAARVCERRGVGLETEILQRLPPVPCSGEARDAIEAACGQLGYEPFGLPSGAGHDGMQLSGLCPIGMVFVRSRDGISHNPAEWSSKEDCAAGAEILYHTLLRLAG